MKLSDSTLKQLAESKTVRRALEDLHNKSFYTIDRWIKENNPMLCHQGSLRLLSLYLKLEIDEMVVMTESDFNPVV